MSRSKEEFNPTEVWQALNELEKEICLCMATGDWQSGFSIDFLQVLGTPEEINSLIKKGAVDAKPAWVFAKEWLDEHSEKIRQINAKTEININSVKTNILTDSERNLLSDFASRNRIFENKSDENLRYRLSSLDFRDFVATQFDEE